VLGWQRKLRVKLDSICFGCLCFDHFDLSNCTNGSVMHWSVLWLSRCQQTDLWNLHLDLILDMWTRVYIYISLINFCRLSLDKTDHLIQNTDHLIQNWMMDSRGYLSCNLKSVVWFYLTEEKPRNKQTFNNIGHGKQKTFCRSEASEASTIHTGGLDPACFSAPLIEPPLWCHSGN